ncbi:glycosyltransferase family 2 protein [Lewinella sp. JB7]|uniref:glycosyltransferase family 2 protein n=1 Tax=Lewinella sp. JB7 TaxID=2962887 RepID=UPI0020C9E022|nr:glycosyltransferase [Lewinella sp. JB7]MCP9237828.1 glycosyltransferase [Lewinella sp. JB7]
MSDISLLTIVRGRRDHLHNLLRGVAQQTAPPREMIIVFMNEAIPRDLPDPGCKLYLHRLNDEDHPLPLAAARNRAASEAGGTMLAFLDVDCIPHPDYLRQLGSAVELTRSLVMGDVRYLPAGSTAGDWNFATLDRVAQQHPRRPALPEEPDSLIPLPYHLFWSLSFGLRATDFARLGGFDEAYSGYGGEDTDFAFTARHGRLPLYACGARVYHQHHDTYSPPYNHLREIVTNAVRFHQKWQIWPMDGWLKQFERAGYIHWNADGIEIIRDVEPQIVEEARSESPFA